ncbi:MAG: YraN family protein [Clostridia bacterium]|nr:YraN family protein [Clostridia bacterium]
MYKKKTVGRMGEDLACKYLMNNNYSVLDRNFSCMQGEIDIIAYDLKNEEVVFFEVKTRTNFNYGIPSEAVNKLKQRHILNSAKYYLYSRRLEDHFVRIDVIEVVINGEKYKLNHLRNVL